MTFSFKFSFDMPRIQHHLCHCLKCCAHFFRPGPATTVSHFVKDWRWLSLTFLRSCHHGTYEATSKQCCCWRRLFAAGQWLHGLVIHRMSTFVKSHWQRMVIDSIKYNTTDIIYCSGRLDIGRVGHWHVEHVCWLQQSWVVTKQMNLKWLSVKIFFLFFWCLVDVWGSKTQDWTTMNIINPSWWQRQCQWQWWANLDHLIGEPGEVQTKALNVETWLVRSLSGDLYFPFKLQWLSSWLFSTTAFFSLSALLSPPSWSSSSLEWVPHRWHSPARFQ